MKYRAMASGPTRETGEDAEQEKQNRSLIHSNMSSLVNLEPNQLKSRENIIRTLVVLFLCIEIFASILGHDDHLNHTTDQSDKPIQAADKLVRSSLGSLQFIVHAADANVDAYADASSESPAVDALEDDDEDDEELNASASNEYPDGENDNDESYEDGDGE